MSDKEVSMAKDIETRREDRPARLWEWLDNDISRWFEGLRPLFRDEDRLRIEQEMIDDNTMVLRAEMPGINPERDVDITVADGVLSIRAERRYEHKEEKEGRTRSEFRYGSFSRTVPVPSDLTVDDVTATYKDGILEVRYPLKQATESARRKVPVQRG
jgi:HSP20 family protein